MPGKNDPSLPGASYLSNWELYRADLEAADDVSTPAKVAEIEEIIDLSRNANGLTNQIWLRTNRTAGAGTVSASLYMNHNGSWAAVKANALITTVDTIGSGDLTKWTGLLAGKYRICLTNVAGGQKWDLHTCHS